MRKIILFCMLVLGTIAYSQILTFNSIDMLEGNTVVTENYKANVVLEFKGDLIKISILDIEIYCTVEGFIKDKTSSGERVMEITANNLFMNKIFIVLFIDETSKHLLFLNNYTFTLYNS